MAQPVQRCPKGGQTAQLVQRCPKGIVPISGISAQVLLDSGFICNLIGEDKLTVLLSKGLVVCEEPTEQILYAYGGRQLDKCAEFTAQVCAGSREVGADFVVIRQRGHV